MSSRGRKKDNFVTFWELYERAAKARYGENIRVRKTDFHQSKVDNIDFEVSIVDVESEPREVRRTIVDINMKEYTNAGKEEDHTLVKISKFSSATKGHRYNFSTTKGVDFGFGGNIGAQVAGLATVGGSIGVSAKYNKSKSTTTGNELSNQVGTSFSYNQEENISVPPGKRVKAKITTYSMKYEVNYTLKLSVRKHTSIPVSFKTRCEQFLPDVCRSTGYVLVKDMISSLPDYVQEDEDGMASFTQGGTLSWIGEGCTVDKTEEDL